MSEKIGLIAGYKPNRISLYNIPSYLSRSEFTVI